MAAQKKKEDAEILPEEAEERVQHQLGCAEEEEILKQVKMKRENKLKGGNPFSATYLQGAFYVVQQLPI